MTHYIQDYIDLVRSGTVPVCREQILLVDLVERTFQQESITVEINGKAVGLLDSMKDICMTSPENLNCTPAPTCSSW